MELDIVCVMIWCVGTTGIYFKYTPRTGTYDISHCHGYQSIVKVGFDVLIYKFHIWQIHIPLSFGAMPECLGVYLCST